MNLRGGVIGWIFMCMCAFMLAACSATQSLQDQVAAVLADFDLSGSVNVTKGGVTIFSSGYGMANRELDQPNTPVAKFRIGSIDCRESWRLLEERWFQTPGKHPYRKLDSPKII